MDPLEINKLVQACRPTGDPAKDASLGTKVMMGFEAVQTLVADAYAEVARLEALFQATHGVHHSWVAGHERMRRAVLAFLSAHDAKDAEAKLAALGSECVGETKGDRR
jgi:ABC-type hemin transport system substrate-binding protein